MVDLDSRLAKGAPPQIACHYDRRWLSIGYPSVYMAGQDRVMDINIDNPRVGGVKSGYEADGWDLVCGVFAGGGPMVGVVRYGWDWQ